MPRVPTDDDFQVQAGTLPSVRLQSADVPDTAGQQLQQLGQQASAAGGQLGKIALDMQQQANQVRVNDAINQVKEEQLRLTYDKDTGFTALKGINALQRPDGKPLAEEYTGTLQKRITALAVTLGNDAQRAQFMQQTGGLLAAFRGDILQHEAGEFKTYSLSVADGIIATAQRDIGLNFANPEATGAAIERIKAETYRQAQLLGTSAEWQDAAVRQAESRAHKLAIDAALEQGDAPLAQQYLSQHKDGMAADDLFQARKGVDDLLGLQLARQRAGEAFEAGVAQAQRVSADTAPGGSFARMVQITLQAESGGRRYGPDGALLQSSAGAKGEMQVLDSTNWNPGFGVTPARDNSPEERARVGRDYLGALLKYYDGDPSKMWAGYNWGPGALDAALKQHGENWLAAAPAETRAYVAKNLQALGGNKLAGTGESAAPPRFDLAAAERRLLQDPQLARNPKLQEAALRQLQHQAKTFQDGVQQQEQQAVANAMRGVIENGGSFDALPLALRQNLPPDKLPELLRYAKAVSEAGEPTTDVNKWLEFTNLAAQENGRPDARCPAGGLPRVLLRCRPAQGRPDDPGRARRAGQGACRWRGPAALEQCRYAQTQRHRAEDSACQRQGGRSAPGAIPGLHRPHAAAGKRLGGRPRQEGIARGAAPATRSGKAQPRALRRMGARSGPSADCAEGRRREARLHRGGRRRNRPCQHPARAARADRAGPAAGGPAGDGTGGGRAVGARRGCTLARNQRG